MKAGAAVLLAAAWMLPSCPADAVAGAPAASHLWHLSGRLVTPDGRAFDYSVLFFRFPSARGPAIDPASLRIVDEERRSLITSRRTERESAGLAATSSDGHAIRVGDWSFSESDVKGKHAMFDLHASEGDTSLTLHGVSRKPRVAFGSDGEISPHIAYTAIAVDGTLAVEHQTIAVSGTSWLDTGPALDAPRTRDERVGRYDIALDDGRELYLESSGTDPYGIEHTAAALVDRDGTVETIPASEYRFSEHLGTTWRSTHTDALYPDLWVVTVAGKTQHMLLQPFLFDQESVAAGKGRPYWDGAIDVMDVTVGSQGNRLGSGEVLLTGFARDGGDR